MMNRFLTWWNRDGNQQNKNLILNYIIKWEAGEETKRMRRHQAKMKKNLIDFSY